MFGSVNCCSSQTASFCVSGGVRGSIVLLQRPLVTATSHLDVGQLVLPVATHQVTWWRAWLNENDFCLADAQRSDGHRSTAAGIFALATRQTSGVDVFLESS